MHDTVGVVGTSEDDADADNMFNFLVSERKLKCSTNLDDDVAASVLAINR